ncbi:MAG: response regulator transcription factor [Myxococcota bacterium]
MTVRVILADDHALVRYGVRRVLEDGGVEVIAEAENGRQAVEKAIELEPDIVLLDVTMPVMAGTEAAKELRRLERPPKVILLTMHVQSSVLNHVFEADASGYILKQDPPTSILTAVETVARGGKYFSPRLSDLLYRHADPRYPEEVRGVDVLSERERQVLKLVADGMTHKEIATVLNISAKTVETHKSNLGRKLGCKTTADFVKFAIREHLTEA